MARTFCLRASANSANSSWTPRRRRRSCGCSSASLRPRVSFPRTRWRIGERCTMRSATRSRARKTCLALSTARRSSQAGGRRTFPRCWMRTMLCASARRNSPPSCTRLSARSMRTKLLLRRSCSTRGCMEARLCSRARMRGWMSASSVCAPAAAAHAPLPHAPRPSRPLTHMTTCPPSPFLCRRGRVNHVVRQVPRAA